jgi:competence protein ComEC
MLVLTGQHDDSARQPRRGRGLIAAACMAAGLLLALQIPAASVWAWCALAGAAALASACASGRWCGVALAVAMAGAGGAWMSARVLTLDGSVAQTRLLMPHADAPGLVRVVGVVQSAARVPPSGYGAWWKRTRDAAPQRVALARVALRQLGPADGRALSPAAGTLWVSVSPASAARAWRAGDVVDLLGEARGVEGPRLPGQRDPRLRAAQDGVVGFLSVQGEGALSLLPRDHDALTAAWFALRRGLDGLRAAARSILDRENEGEARPPTPREQQGAALIRALLIGDDDPALAPVAESWGRLGLLHALSISGFHIAVVAGLVLVLVRLTGDRGHAEPLIALALIALYLLIVPAAAPVLRSGVCIAAILLAESLGRRYDALSVLGWVAVGLLLWRPLDVLDPGFQLSFGLTAVLLAMGESTRRWMFAPRGVRGRVRPRETTARLLTRGAGRAVSALIATSVLAWAVATPIVAYHFGVFSPLAIIASILVVPIIVPTLWLGYLTLLLGTLWPGAGDACAGVLEWLGRLLVDLTVWMDELPGAGIVTPAVPLWLAAAATVAVLWLFVRRSLREPGPWLALAIIIAGTGLVLTRAWRGDGVRAAVLDIPEGSCALVRSGRDAILVDAGSDRAGFTRRAGRDVPAALRHLGAWRVHTLVITRAEPGSWSFAAAMVRPLGVRRALVAPVIAEIARTRPGSPEAIVLDQLREEGVTVQEVGAGDALELDAGVRVVFSLDRARGLLVALQGDDGTSWIPRSVEPAK